MRPRHDAQALAIAYVGKDVRLQTQLSLYIAAMVHQNWCTTKRIHKNKNSWTQRTTSHTRSQNVRNDPKLSKYTALRHSRNLHLWCQSAMTRNQRNFHNDGNLWTSSTASVRKDGNLPQTSVETLTKESMTDLTGNIDWTTKVLFLRIWNREDIYI